MTAVFRDIGGLLGDLLDGTAGQRLTQEVAGRYGSGYKDSYFHRLLFLLLIFLVVPNSMNCI
jgi:hypothetical protein